MTRKFQNREEAARQLASRLRDQISQSNSSDTKWIVYAIPSGGIPVAKVIAQELGADLDIAPNVQAPAVSALENTNAESKDFSSVVNDRKSDDFLDPKEIDVIIVDDVIRSGRTQQTAIRQLRDRGASRIVVAGIVVTDEARKILKEEDCELVVLGSAHAEGSDDDYFEEASNLSAQDTFDIRERARRFPTGAQSSSTSGPQKLNVDLDGERLRAGLSIPVEALGIVIFACGDEKSRESMVGLAKNLNEQKLATLILDNVRKDATSRSLRKTIEWLTENRETSLLPVGLVAKGESASAAVDAASAVPEKMRCLVLLEAQLASSEKVLPYVQAPTLVVLRQEDAGLTADVRGALDSMTSEKTLVVVDAAEFDEEVSRATVAWLERFLLPIRPSRGASAAQASVLQN